MKKNTLLLILLLTISFGYGQTTLNAGEIAITGANANNPDQFSFVLLTDVLNGTVINFTDCGVTAAGAFRNLNTGTGTIAEGIVTWTATSDLSCGTEIIIEETAAGSNVYTVTNGTASETDDGFGIGGNGDQIIAFQGTTLSPSFLFALHFADSLGWATDATNNQTSTVPTGLTDGTNAVAIEATENNIIYNYITLGDSIEILAALVDSSQWILSNPRLELEPPVGASFSCDTSTTYTTTSLTAGEIAITGANADNPDEFSFVLLTDVLIGTEIHFTDGGWTAAGEFRGYNAANGTIAEGIVTWTADSDLPCGTEIIIAETASGSNVYTATIGATSETDNGFALGANGDQLFAFQGTTLNPDFIYALHFANATGWVSDATDTLTSALPTGLTEGVNAVSRNRDNIAYTYNVTGNTSLILAAISDPAEWVGNSATRQALGRPTGTFNCDATILEKGDVAITGANASATEGFSFVLLTDIDAGTEINFTDGGWLAGGGFRAYSFTDSNPSATIGEGVLKWTADSFLECGTEIVITDTGSDTWSATIDDSPTVVGEVIESEVGFVLGGADQIIVFQQTTTTPKFLHALHFGNNLGWSTDATNGATSNVPAGLTDGVDAVAINLDNIIYNYSVTTNQSLILAALVNPDNWEGDNTTPQSLGRPDNTFSCTATGDCDQTALWSGGAWSGDPLGLDTAVIIADDYNTSTGTDGIFSFSACELTIFSGFTLTVADNTFLVIENDVTINGNLIVETKGSLIQNGVSASAGTFTGSATLNKTTPVKDEWYYYTFWSSPVANQAIDILFPNVDANRRFTFNAANFVDNSPTDGVDDNGDVWGTAAGTMTPGLAYLATGERVNNGLYPRADTVSFTGTFNTGNIDVPITFDPTNIGTRWNFIGNPYPGAIDFVAFQLANATVIDGAAYFWSQASPLSASNPGNSELNVNQNDYAIFTVGTGGAAGGGPDIPNGYVASGQGFFALAKASLINPVGNSVTFTNSIRVADGTSNNQFFKSSNSKKSSASSVNPLENRLWVNLTTDNGVFHQILVGYVDKATDYYDGLSYDAPKLLNAGYAAALYSKIENNDTRYMIQGKAINSINENEVIKLGFINAKINEDTQFKLSIAQFEGSFLTDNTIYLKDNLLNTVHNLSDSDYIFTSGIGEYRNRFEIVFSAQSLSTNDTITNDNTLKIVQLDDDNVQFTVSDNLSIKSVSIFDLLGRELYSLKGTRSSETYRLSNLQDAIYIAKVELSNGAIITKKALKK